MVLRSGCILAKLAQRLFSHLRNGTLTPAPRDSVVSATCATFNLLCGLPSSFPGVSNLLGLLIVCCFHFLKAILIQLFRC